ncbi:hypothetical protein ETB97_004583 [Aspergillus alliaceus]|uniref:Putative oxalocrotonate tautomerase n=1 Tax=Petromyces alliaceus TaxID=209559 RepID=A0A5N7C242_PETAA|nr:putative oxalocrotonate tautomerase [Aspergillus alliaceus]KAF5858303.1 hypothetical protein ETB97_004583 [Aspergillus burnettii]
MPLWLIFHPTGTFEDTASKKALTEDVTKIYTRIGLPAFYVVINFIKLSAGDIWVGAENKTENPFIRIVAEHIAVRLDNEDHAYNSVCNSFEKALKPHIADRGYEWEFHIDETERRLWRVNGLVPPPFGSDAEKIWAKENKPVRWEGA